VDQLRLRCVANRGVFLPAGRRPRGTTAASAFAVTPGRTYVAAGVLALADHLSVLVRDDWGGPAFVPAELFAEVTTALPAGWSFALDSGARAGRRTLWGEPCVAVWGYAELVEDEGHVAALLAGDPRAVAVCLGEIDRRPADAGRPARRPAQDRPRPPR
jgi:hypothetical protein